MGPYSATVALNELIEAPIGLLTVPAKRNSTASATTVNSASSSKNREKIGSDSSLSSPPDHNYSVSITLGIAEPSNGGWESSPMFNFPPWIAGGMSTEVMNASLERKDAIAAGILPQVAPRFFIVSLYLTLAVFVATLAMILATLGSAPIVVGLWNGVILSLLWMFAGAALFWNVLAIAQNRPGRGESAVSSLLDSDGTATVLPSSGRAEGALLGGKDGLVIKLMHAEIAEELKEEEAPEEEEKKGGTTAGGAGGLQGATLDKQYTISLDAADIAEAEGEDEEGPLIARRFTESLAVRHKYLEHNSRVAGKEGGVGLVDIGAVNMRRVITSTATSVTIEEEERAEFVRRVGSFERGESASLAMIHAISPAITPTLLERYVIACGGDRSKAMQRLRQTAEWRSSHGIDKVLSSPVPHFNALKTIYLHSVIGWTKDKTMPIVVEGMGGFKAAISQVRKQKIAPADLIHQFIFMMEWVINDLTPGPYPSGSFVRIYDLKGIALLDLADKEAIGIGQQMMDILEKYYPERMAHAFVVNTPSFFATAWRMVKPLLDPRTAKKIQVLSNPKITLTALREVMDDDVIPVAYGGKNQGDGYKLGFQEWYKSPEEKKIAALATKLNGVGGGGSSGAFVKQ